MMVMESAMSQITALLWPTLIRQMVTATESGTCVTAVRTMMVTASATRWITALHNATDCSLMLITMEQEMSVILLRVAGEDVDHRLVRQGVE
jgi:hypothetical protein